MKITRFLRHIKDRLDIPYISIHTYIHTKRIITTAIKSNLLGLEKREHGKKEKENKIERKLFLIYKLLQCVT